MLKSKEVQSIALGIAMLIIGMVVTIKVGVPPAQEQELYQVDVLALMSHSRDLPVDLHVSP